MGVGSGVSMKPAQISLTWLTIVVFGADPFNSRRRNLTPL